MARLLLFAAAREAAGTREVEIDAATVGELLDAARSRFGEHFSAVLAHSKVWCNGEPAGSGDPIGAGDEVAVLPPVSGG
jgi:MoaD family protein